MFNLNDKLVKARKLIPDLVVNTVVTNKGYLQLELYSNSSLGLAGVALEVSVIEMAKVGAVHVIEMRFDKCVTSILEFYARNNISPSSK